MEKKLQRQVIKFLKENGAYVIKTKPGMGTPVGCPDIIALYKTRWAAVEVKASASAPYRAGQLATLTHLRGWSNYSVCVVAPETFEDFKKSFMRYFFNAD